MAKKNADTFALENVLGRWRLLREQTGSHAVSCVCEHCSSRRRLGALIDMPYADKPTAHNSKLRPA